MYGLKSHIRAAFNSYICMAKAKRVPSADFAVHHVEATDYSLAPHCKALTNRLPIF